MSVWTSARSEVNYEGQDARNASLRGIATYLKQTAGVPNAWLAHVGLAGRSDHPARKFIEQLQAPARAGPKADDAFKPGSLEMPVRAWFRARSDSDKTDSGLRRRQAQTAVVSFNALVERRVGD